MTIMVDGVKLSEKRIDKVGERVRGRMKNSLSYLTKMMKGLYSGDMNNDNDFRALQDKIVADLIETNSKTICIDVKNIVKEEMISVAHQCGSQAMREAMVIGSRDRAPEWDYDNEQVTINLDNISSGKVRIGDHIADIDFANLKREIQNRLAEAHDKKVGVGKEHEPCGINISPIPEGASKRKKDEIRDRNNLRELGVFDEKSKDWQATVIDMTEELKDDPNAVATESSPKKKKKTAKKKVVAKKKKTTTKKKRERKK